MLFALLPVGRSCVLSFKNLSLISLAKCLPSPLLTIRETPAARQGALYVENPSNSGCCYCIGQAAVCAVVFSLMDKGSLSPTAVIPLGWLGLQWSQRGRDLAQK